MGELKVGELKQENELLLLQLHQVQEELENQFLQESSGNSEDSIKKLQSEKQIVREKLKCQEQENDLLLVQIDNLQEELESYYVKYEELSHNKQRESSRFAIGDLSLIEVLRNTDYGELSWKASEINYNNRFIPSIIFKIVRNNDSLLLEICPDSEADYKGVIWSEVMGVEGGTCLQIEPKPTKQSMPSVIKNMGATCWGISNLLVSESLLKLSESTGKLSEEEDLNDRSFWLRNHAEAKEVLSLSGSFARFDGLIVREYYQTDGYQHIWIELENLTIGERYYEYYQYKLVFKDFNGSEVPATIALAFRELEGGRSPLLVWPPSTQDEFGSVLIIEFDAESGTILSKISDVWKEDLVFIQKLAACLPKQIGECFESDFDLGGYTREGLDKLISSVADACVQQALYSVEPAKESQIELDVNFESCELIENYSEGQYAHLGVRLKEFKFKDCYWPEYDFKVFARKINNELEPIWAGLEFRVMSSGLAPLVSWPTEYIEYDDFGGFMLVPFQKNNIELNGIDQQIVDYIFDCLPNWLEIISLKMQDVEHGWDFWQRLLTKN